MSSGKSNRPAEGRILYFSETVWVLTSSSLPALEGARESSKGFGLYIRLGESETQLVLLESANGLDANNGTVSSSRYFFDCDAPGGNSLSEGSMNLGVLGNDGVLAPLDVPSKFREFVVCVDKAGGRLLSSPTVMVPSGNVTVGGCANGEGLRGALDMSMIR